MLLFKVYLEPAWNLAVVPFSSSVHPANVYPCFVGTLFVRVKSTSSILSWEAIWLPPFEL